MARVAEGKKDLWPVGALSIVPYTDGTVIVVDVT